MLVVGPSGGGHESLPATARLAAAGRAVEHWRTDRLFADPLAEALAGREGFRLMERWRLPGAPRENPTIGPRTRFYDDLVIDAVADGVGQVVLIAAGMDTRAFRLALPAEVVVFDGDEWPRALAAGGFDHAARTAFIVEGLSWYLTEAENARLLDDLARLAAPREPARDRHHQPGAPGKPGLRPVLRLGRWPPPAVGRTSPLTPSDLAAMPFLRARRTPHRSC